MTRSFLFGSRYLNYELSDVYDSWLVESIGHYHNNLLRGVNKNTVYVDRERGLLLQAEFINDYIPLGHLHDILTEEQMSWNIDDDWDTFLTDHMNLEILVTKRCLEYMDTLLPYMQETERDLYKSLIFDHNGYIFYEYSGHRILGQVDDDYDSRQAKLFIFETDMTMETDPKVYLENYERVQAYHRQEWYEIGLFIYRNALDGENYSLESDKMGSQYLFDKLCTSGLVKPTTQIDTPTVGCYAFHAPLYHHEDLDNYEMECGKIAEIDGLHFVFEDGRRVYINKGWIYFNELSN